MINTEAYTLGRLAAALEADERTVYRACGSPALLTPIITKATQDAQRRAQIAPLMESLTDIPDALDNAEQSDFWLGYYHQCYTQRVGTPTPVDAPAGDARLEVRLPEDLKAWALANGGGKLVRALLYAAKERAKDRDAGGVE